MTRIAGAALGMVAAWVMAGGLLAGGTSVRLAAQSAGSEATREKWQRIPELFHLAGIGAGSVVADVGAGNGFLTIRLAAVVGPFGKVYAVDIAPDAIKTLRSSVAKLNLTNVEVIAGAEDDPRLPTGALDALVMINAYHEIARPQIVLARFREALRPNGRLVLCEPRPKAPGGTRAEQAARHVIDPQFIESELKEAHFEIGTRDDSFAANPSGPDAPYPYTLVIARRP